MRITDILDHATKIHGDSPALKRDGRDETYAVFAERVRRTAAGITGEGAGKGARVAVLLPNGPEFLELYFASPMVGTVLVPLNTRLAAPEIAAVLEDAGAHLLVYDESFESLACEAAARAKEKPHLVRVTGNGGEPAVGSGSAVGDVPDPADAGDEKEPAQLYYTSGTTGAPKGVILTHRNVCSHAMMASAELTLSHRDVWLHAAPMFHLADAWACFAVTWAGGRHVFAPRFEPGLVLDMILKQGVTLTNLVPTMLNALVAHPGASDRAYPSLRVLLSGGAPIAPALVRRIMDTFKCDYIQTYGLTETSPYLTLSKLEASLERLPEEERFWYKACTGRPLRGVNLRVVDGSGRDVPADREAVGEIVVRGPSVTPGYWRNPEETEKAFQGGWFHTGDLAVMDGEGYVNIVDRKKDVIVTGGEQVYSVEVENALLRHPAVFEAAVVAVPDEVWGEAVKAVVVLKEGHEVGAGVLIAFCREAMASYKAPKSVDFTDGLPRTGSKKIDKRAVRERYWTGRDRRVH
ncbi:MAG: long-chain-fatty-acid--CoA ligase [Planctomycetota bacterium]|jgi:acyl-CoA synthetase (AMP-forming)/AMP-acid ligase II